MYAPPPGCPSRSETVTGRYLHNVHTPPVEKQCNESYSGQDDAGNVCCMHVDEVLVNNYTMAKYMKEQKGYTSGMFGKYLNNCPDTAQPGWDAWFANGGGNCKCSSCLWVFFLRSLKEARLRRLQPLVRRRGHRGPARRAELPVRHAVPVRRRDGVAVLDRPDRELLHRLDPEGRQGEQAVVRLHWLQGRARAVPAKPLVQGLLGAELAGDGAAPALLELLDGEQGKAPPQHRVAVHADGQRSVLHRRLFQE